VLLVALLACGSDQGGSDKDASDADGGACNCPADKTVECDGVVTPVSLPPVVCNGESTTNDAPARGYPLGSTPVRYKSGADSCTTRVTITDTKPPTMDCAGLPDVLIPKAGDSAPSPLPVATDPCAKSVTVTASPSKLSAHGATPVTYTAVGAGGEKATCKTTLTVRNAFAATDLRLAHAEITTTGTSVIIIWDTPTGSDADMYRVERAPAPSGPWTTLGTAPVAAPIFTDPMLPATQAFYRVVTLVQGAVGGASDPIRALAVTASEYDLGVLPIPGFDMPANPSAGTPDTTSAPVHAYVRYPTNVGSTEPGGPYPLALLLHGNHGNCRPPDYDATGEDPDLDDACIVSNTNACPAGYTPSPNAQGLLYLAETLSSRGYVVASVDANAVNCREDYSGGVTDGYISQRAELLIEHMRLWQTWATTGAAPFSSLFADHVDMGHVIVFGHSRGAEAVAEVPQTLAASTDVTGIGLAAAFSLAPTNFDDPQPGTVPFATLVPICDGDVFTYTGVQLYDRTLRNVGGKGEEVQLFMAHADHDHFNTNWNFDDNDIYLGNCWAGVVDAPPMQQRVLEVVVGTWVDEVVPTGSALEPWLHAVGDVPPSIVLYAAAAAPLELRRSYSSATLLKIDNFESGSETGPPPADLLGGSYSSAGGFADGTPGVCTGVSSPACDTVYTADDDGNSVTFGWPHYNFFDQTPERAALALDWNAASAVLTGNLAAGSGSLDASTYAALSLRVASRASPTNADAVDGPVDFQVSIVDASGHRGSALASQVTTVHNLYQSDYPRAVLQTVRFALPGLAAASKPAVDLHHLSRIEIAMSAAAQASGSILVTDVELAQ
jgi:hypothetical protein